MAEGTGVDFTGVVEDPTPVVTMGSGWDEAPTGRLMGETSRESNLGLDAAVMAGAAAGAARPEFESGVSVDFIGRGVSVDFIGAGEGAATDGVELTSLEIGAGAVVGAKSFAGAAGGVSVTAAAAADVADLDVGAGAVSDNAEARAGAGSPLDSSSRTLLRSSSSMALFSWTISELAAASGAT